MCTLNEQSQKQPSQLAGIFQQQIEQHFSKLPKKRTPSRGIPNFLPEVFFPFIFAPGISRQNFRFEWFAFRKFNSFRNFWKLFLEISIPFASVSKFPKVLIEWKAPLILCPIAFIAEKINEGEVKADWSNISSCSIRLRNKVHQQYPYT